MSDVEIARFATYVATLGRGPGRSRPLTRAEAADAMALLLADAPDRLQVGAFLMLLRYRGEDPDEIAGLVEGARDATRIEGAVADLDWPSYGAGRTRGAPWFLLAALALAAGGVRVLEVTLRTPVALKCMEAIARAVPDAILGAGTVRSAADAQAARDAGCRFAVSPGYTPALGSACRSIGLPLLPGVATASEVMIAQADGIHFVKFFPATAAGGVPMLKALAGPLPDVLFCPTGGITLESAPQFLALPNVKVVGGSWLTPADAVAAGDWGRITAFARDAGRLRTDG